MSDDKVEAESEISSAQSDLQAVRDDLIAIRADLDALLSSSTRVAAGEAMRQREKVEHIAEDIAMTAEDYLANLEETLRRHPLTALGVALAAGMLITSMSRER